MRSTCVECGHPTNKGLTVCIYCRTGRSRAERVCEDCGDTVAVRQDRTPPARNRCPRCRNRREVERLLQAALPILEGGGTLADVGRALRLSGERIRQIIARHPELAHLHRKTLGERKVGAVLALLETGEVVAEAARKCGISKHTLRGILRVHPALHALAIQNHARRHAQRFDPLFRMVEQDGLSIRAACGKLGIKCRMAIYAVARTREAQERFPSLSQVPSRKRIPDLQIGSGRTDLQNVG